MRQLGKLIEFGGTKSIIAYLKTSPYVNYYHINATGWTE